MEQDYPTFIKFFVGTLSENIEAESNQGNIIEQSPTFDKLEQG